ncbi:hypothetical protein BDV95DRAFT_612883 [Massariosphaeria phaeospora]|uniref:Uncharacterized protein n=1 Tax=Massariosphaeria phaeospora TaxID=100035 RepID=A0A7C8HYK4_9PLEO|nr:hypothetical protein BDV95DRAFT_612883 [Massariosphaeria phaeospora]
MAHLPRALAATLRPASHQLLSYNAQTRIPIAPFANEVRDADGNSNTNTNTATSTSTTTTRCLLPAKPATTTLHVQRYHSHSHSHQHALHQAHQLTHMNSSALGTACKFVDLFFRVPRLDAALEAAVKQEVRRGAEGKQKDKGGKKPVGGNGNEGAGGGQGKAQEAYSEHQRLNAFS